jgi:hypothetical protein
MDKFKKAISDELKSHLEIDGEEKLIADMKRIATHDDEFQSGTAKWALDHFAELTAR